MRQNVSALSKLRFYFPDSVEMFVYVNHLEGARNPEWAQFDSLAVRLHHACGLELQLSGHSPNRVRALEPDVVFALKD